MARRAADLVRNLFDPFVTTKSNGSPAWVLRLSRRSSAVTAASWNAIVRTGATFNSDADLRDGRPTKPLPPTWQRRPERPEGLKTMGKATILVADDDAAIRTVLNQALTRAGYSVRVTSNATTLVALGLEPARGIW
jgi:hypothetical protein